jgi:hypothetical protein
MKTSEESNNKIFSSWLLFQQVINDIQTLPIYGYTKKLLQEENSTDKKTKIILTHIQLYNLNIL